MLVLAALIVASLPPSAPEPPRGPLPTIGPLWILQPPPEGPYPRSDSEWNQGLWQAPAPKEGCDRLSVYTGPKGVTMVLVLERDQCQEGVEPWPGPPAGLAGFEAFAGLKLGSPETEVLERLGPPGSTQEGNGRRTHTWFRACDANGALVPEGAESVAYGLAFQVTIRGGVAVRYFVNAD